eukprot:TRINITY_DN7837_c0_g1_i1.p1 TRINITY_DN7837_c0_g1~~TRINITY_DN7837_c0_g1_i1.p1  ORF type:complete len:349 (+),score=83.36 TRINITY_DN7837_c0_g1_i1:96-1049(+)
MSMTGEIARITDELMKSIQLEQSLLVQARNQLDTAQKEWQDCTLKFRYTLPKRGERVRLDVGGTVFCTTLSTLTRVEQSYFASMFSGRWPLEQQDDGSYFVDRDPFVFRHVLNYLRGENIELSELSVAERKALLRDIDFYQLPELRQAISKSPLMPGYKVQPSWRPGPSYRIDGARATKTSAALWNAVLLASSAVEDGVHEWSVRVDGTSVMVGVAPEGVDQQATENYSRCGWYLYSADCGLFCQPGSLKAQQSAPRAVPAGSVVRVVLDASGLMASVAFTVAGVHLGTMFPSVPKDQPLTLCVLLYNLDDSVTLLS